MFFKCDMPSLAAPQPDKVDTLSLEGELVCFDAIPCLLTADELNRKCEEQFAVIWNGLNIPF